MNNIDTKLKGIDESIQKLNSINNIKKKVTEHNNIEKSLHDINLELQNIKDHIESYTVKKTKDDVITDETFVVMIDDLNNLSKQQLNDHSLEQLINIYENAAHMINLCDTYLEKQKLEVITID